MKIELLIATFNPGKVREIKHLLDVEPTDITLHSLSDFDIKEKSRETGKTFLENAEQKSLFYSKKVKDIFVVAEDSGLEVNALNGEPGIFSSRYAGDHSTDEQNIKKLLKKLENTSERSARFVSVVSVSQNGKLIKSFTGEVHGEILKKKRGSQGFGYDPVFYYPPLKKTFAQLSTEQKNTISHRSKSINKLKKFLLNL